MHAGADRSLIGRPPVGYNYYGDDAFGDIKDDTLPSMNLVKGEPAALTLVRLANENPGQVFVNSAFTLICFEFYY